MENTLKKRWEIPTEDTWNMADILPSDQAWEQLYQELSEKIKQYEAFSGTLSQSSQRLYQCLVFEDDCSLGIETLFVYARQCFDQDTSNQKYQDFTQRAQALSFLAGQYSAFLVPEMMELEEDLLKQWLSTDQDLKKYERALTLLQRKRAHTLSKDQELLLARSMDATQSPQRIFTMFHDADLKFPVIKDQDGKDLQITHGNFIALLRQADQRVRKDAFMGLYGVYGQFRNTMAAVLSANLKQADFYAKARRFESTRQSYLYENEIPESVYDSLLETVRRFLPGLHRYMALRKKVLGLSTLHMYDLFVPLTEATDRKYSYEKAKQMVLEGLKPLGREYGELLTQGFENRWIDVYENEAKRSGAYSWGVYKIHPYVLLNYNHTLDYVFTLAHEMGHALHSYYSDENQPYVYASYKIFVAEVASTCNEALLIRHLLSTTEDKKEKAYLLNYFLESYRNTLFRQTMFAEFEHRIHQLQASGQSLTAEVLCDLYHKLNEEYYGPDVMVDREIAYEWERIPHFYTPFYVYQYATGFSAAVAISSRILAGDQAAMNGYFAFLKGGCSLEPLKLLELCGVDMSSPKPVEQALMLFEELLGELEQLLKN